MFKNYLVTTIRNLIRNKANTVINVTGLAISIACCVVVYVFIRHEKTFDSFHSKADRIYRVVIDERSAQGIANEGYINFAAAKALRNDFPNLESVTQVYVRNNAIVSTNEPGQNRKVFEEFAWLVIIAFIVAAPLGYIAMKSWLQTFENRIDISAVYFIIAFVVSLLVAALTVGFQAVKAAVANPVKSLRSE